MALDPSDVSLRSVRPDDRDWIVTAHADLYARDEGFDATFGTLVRNILDDFLTKYDPATEHGWVAETAESPLGCIFCTRSDDPDIARLRMFLLLPEARGLGLGQRLLDQCLAFARGLGSKQIYLWTHESHRAACALYRKNGFRMTSSVEKHSFGVDVVEQEWIRDLA